MYERLTKRGYKFDMLNILQGLNKYTEIDEIMNRLAAYEDTGLSPEEITEKLKELTASKSPQMNGMVSRKSSAKHYCCTRSSISPARKTRRPVI